MSEEEKLKKELEDTKAELEKTRAALLASQAPFNLLGQKGFKPCAEVEFKPNTVEK